MGNNIRTVLSNWLVAQLYNYTWCIHDPVVRELMPNQSHCTCIGRHTRTLPRSRSTSITTDWWIAEQRKTRTRLHRIVANDIRPPNDSYRLCSPVSAPFHALA